MPTPTKPVLVGGKSASLGAGDYVIFRNLTNGSTMIGKCDSNGQVVIDNVPSTWSEGNTISIEVQGRYAKGSTKTITKGGVSVDFGTLTADDMPAISL